MSSARREPWGTRRSAEHFIVHVTNEGAGAIVHDPITATSG